MALLVLGVMAPTRGVCGSRGAWRGGAGTASERFQTRGSPGSRSAGFRCGAAYIRAAPERGRGSLAWYTSSPDATFRHQIQTT